MGIRIIEEYKGFKIRTYSSKDSDGFDRYNCDILIGGQWSAVSWDALDTETMYKELDKWLENHGLIARTLWEKSIELNSNWDKRF